MHGWDGLGTADRGAIGCSERDTDAQNRPKTASTLDRVFRPLIAPMDRFRKDLEAVKCCAVQGSNRLHPTEHQALAKSNTPQRTPSLESGLGELEEIAAAWDGLPAALRSAILGIVRSVQPDTRA